MTKNKIIAICGGSASGKTFISHQLCKKNPKNSVLISQDEYYKSFNELTIAERKLINYDYPNAYDIELLVRNLNSLKNGKNVEQPIYSFSEYDRIGTKTIFPKPIIILEGMLALYSPNIRKIIDKSIYIDCLEQVRLQRMIKRDVSERGRTPEWGIEQYNRDMKPMNEQFVEPQKIFADIIIDGNQKEEIVYKLVESFLEKNNILKSYER